MEVLTGQLKNEIIKFNRLLEEYEENSLNLYNEISLSSFFWRDPHAQKFYDMVSDEKEKVRKNILSLRQLQDVYEYLIEQYESFGKKVQYDLSKKQNILSSYDKVIEKTHFILKQYSAIYLQFLNREAYIIEQEKNSIEKTYTQLVQSREIVKKSFVKIEEIEKETYHLLSKIKIEIIQETDIRGVI